MDASRFDCWTRRIRPLSSRRRALAALLGSVAVGFGTAASDARRGKKRKRKRKKQPKPCAPGTKRCGSACIPEKACCICSDGALCDDGVCSCLEGTTDCGNGCVDLATDRANCGACGRACETDTCINGACPRGCETADDCPEGCTCSFAIKGANLVKVCGIAGTQLCNSGADCPLGSFCFLVGEVVFACGESCTG